ncbi:MAG: hypothetical protein ACI9ZH_000252 [Paracoccaceae bacterium]|jgi:hypothetical protein
MTWLKFIDSVIGNIAWPVVVIFISWFFKKEVEKLFKYLSTVKFGNFEASFSSDISKVSETIDESIEDVGDINAAGLDNFETFDEFSKVSPRGAILASWIELQARMNDKYVKAKDEKGFASPRVLAKLALDDGTFSKDQYQAFLKLNDLRNAAAHVAEFNLSVHDAQSYIRSVRQLSSLLKG